MTSISIIDCCQMLSVDPKTLRQWLTQAQISLHNHPTDGRLKCLTDEQVRDLANLHGRVLQQPAAIASPQSDEVQTQVPPPAVAEASLRERLTQMEAQIATLQTQLTALSLQLLQERQQSTQLSLLALQAQLTLTGEQALAPLAPPAPPVPGLTQMPALALHPTEKRTRLIPLIEYGAGGRYVLICPKEGEVHITPDSAEWFVWLASLSSFRFVGKSGCFSARRGYNHRPNRCWYAQRGIHQKNYNKYIGVSENVTIERLEYIAAQLQSYLTLR